MITNASSEQELVVEYSQFIKRTLSRYPHIKERVLEFLDSKDTPLEDRLSVYLEPTPSTIDQFMKAIRLFRAEEMVRIAWRDITQRADTRETLLDLTSLAELLLQRSISFLREVFEARFGTPRDAHGTPQGLLVLGMGKLGGRELNFSSDIDLIFSYPAQGRTDHPQNPLTNQEFFERLTREVIRVLSAVTEDGFCFRVDTRLRPFGDSGPICMDFDQMEDYYEIHGREWERYALVKARPVAGEKGAGALLLERLRPFVYRRYLDFGAIETLREMKALIEKEAQKRSYQENLKLGPGGIREVEFIVQAFQLIHGGRLPPLTTPSTLEALDRLAEHQILPIGTVEGLKDAYLFLRRVENLIQEKDDRQVHSLPHDPLDLQRLSSLMGAPSTNTFLSTLASKRHCVRRHFEALFSREDQYLEGHETDWPRLIWGEVLDDEGAATHLREHGFNEPQLILKRIRSYKNSSNFRGLSDRSKRFLEIIVPRLLMLSTTAPDPGQAFARALDVLAAIGKRGFYLALLAENPKVLENLVEFVGSSPWVSTYLCRHPGVMDSLITLEALSEVPTMDEIEGALKASLQHVSPGDTEAFLDALRHFKHTYTFELAYLLMEKDKDVLEITRAYTQVAESVLKTVFDEACDALGKRYKLKVDGEWPFLILGYGKLGSRELTFSSDLDLVFIHGKKTHDMSFTRLGQRIIHSLTALTPAGRLFEVDMRLRPDGDQGVLISSISAYREYQLNQAWTWEHQALVRARPICGSHHLAKEFTAIRREVLMRGREEDRLKREFSSMRAKMLGAVTKKEGVFDIKHGLGGLTDIEFIAQFYALLYAREYPEILKETATASILRLLGSHGIIGPEVSERLVQIFTHYLKEIETGFLTTRGHMVPTSDPIDEMRNFVIEAAPYLSRD